MPPWLLALLAVAAAAVPPWMHAYGEECLATSQDAPSTKHGGGDRSIPDGHPANPTDCALFLAESTIPNAGLGLFTGVDVARGQEVGGGEIVVPLFDLDFHNDDSETTFDDYVWFGDHFHEMDNEAESVLALVPRLGAAINCHLGLINLKGISDFITYDSFGLHRSRDPGAGAMTNFQSSSSIATKEIPAGAELFVDYGEGWFTSRTRELGLIPLKEDFTRAMSFMPRYKAFLESNENKVTRPMETDLWDLIRHFNNESRTLNALPTSATAARDAMEIGVEKALSRSTVRSKEWLNKYGKCVDNIRRGRSTVPQAGLGAFARRFIPKGDLIAPAPLIHIVDGRNVMNIYAQKSDLVDGDKFVKDNSTVVGRQLALNYCFGHNQSTMLLCPYGGVEALINHNSQEPNARIQWADSSSFGHNADWLDEPVAALGKKMTPGLQLEFVATTDIMAEEEIFIDYGKAWEEAWDYHVRTWKPPQDRTFIRASELNEKYADHALRTTKEQETDPYPSSVQIGCHYRPRKHVSEDGDSDTEYERAYGPSDLRLHGIYPCDVLSRSEDGLYTAQVLGKNATRITTNQSSKNARHNEANYDPRTIPKGEKHFLTGIPRQAIEFIDKPYSGDYHLPNAFRHEIMIPDAIFPEAWKNLKSSSE